MIQFWTPFWGPYLDPKMGSAIGEFRCCPHMLCKQICDPAAWTWNVNSYLFLFVRPKSGCYCTNTLDDTMISPFRQLLTLRTGQPFTLPCLFGLFVCCCCFAVLLFSLFCSTGIVTDGYLDCVLVLCQFNFCSPPSAKMDNVTALIKKLTDMQHFSVENDLAEAKRRWTEKMCCVVAQKGAWSCRSRRCWLLGSFFGLNALALQENIARLIA